MYLAFKILLNAKSSLGHPHPLSLSVISLSVSHTHLCSNLSSARKRLSTFVELSKYQHSSVQLFYFLFSLSIIFFLSFCCSVSHFLTLKCFCLSVCFTPGLKFKLLTNQRQTKLLTNISVMIFFNDFLFFYKDTCVMVSGG